MCLLYIIVPCHVCAVALTLSETYWLRRLSDTHGPITPHTFSSRQHYKTVLVRFCYEQYTSVQSSVKGQTLTSKEALKAMRKFCPWASLANTFCQVCLKSVVLKESPITMWPLSNTRQCIKELVNYVSHYNKVLPYNLAVLRNENHCKMLGARMKCGCSIAQHMQKEAVWRYSFFSFSPPTELTRYCLRGTSSHRVQAGRGHRHTRPHSDHCQLLSWPEPHSAAWGEGKTMDLPDWWSVLTDQRSVYKDCLGQTACYSYTNNSVIDRMLSTIIIDIPCRPSWSNLRCLCPDRCGIELGLLTPLPPPSLDPTDRHATHPVIHVLTTLVLAVK